MIVVDVNVVAYLMVEGPKRAQARELFVRYPQWLLPTLWRHEFLNILATGVKASHYSLGQAEALWAKTYALLAGSEGQPDMMLALALAVEHKLSAYDAQYVALAQEHDIVCVSEDAELKKRAPKGLIKSLGEMLA
jgi:predicted nucleic acid-binding protein